MGVWCPTLQRYIGLENTAQLEIQIQTNMLIDLRLKHTKSKWIINCVSNFWSLLIIFLKLNMCKKIYWRNKSKIIFIKLNGYCLTSCKPTPIVCNVHVKYMAWLIVCSIWWNENTSIDPANPIWLPYLVLYMKHLFQISPWPHKQYCTHT